MTLALDGAGIDGGAYRDVVDLAGRSPGWLDDLVAAWSSFGLALFALLAVLAWWRARRTGPEAGGLSMAVPVAVCAAFAVSSVVKLMVREVRPCRTLHVTGTLEACPARADWSFPSNHATIAAAAAVALLFVSRALGALAVLAALAMAVSRVWVGVHYPHDAAAGLLVGAVCAAVCMVLARRWVPWVVRRFGAEVAGVPRVAA